MNHTCCFLGHRKINENEKLKSELREIIERLITKEEVDTFLFGSGSRFSDLCYDLVSEAQEKYPYIKRIYVRAEYMDISDDYRNYLLKSYEDTYFPNKAIGAGRTVYVERNYEMIDKSRICIIYYDEENKPKNRKSGTEIAYSYAVKRHKQIIMLP